MTKHIKIHENDVHEDDIEELNELLRQLSPDNAPEITYDIVQEVMKNATVFVLRDHSPESLKRKPKGKIIGKALLLHSKKFMFFVGHIDDVVVHENFRGKGLGKMLTDAMIKKGKELGMRHIELTSNPKRLAAINLYQKAGFKKRETNVFRLKL